MIQRYKEIAGVTRHLGGWRHDLPRVKAAPKLFVSPDKLEAARLRAYALLQAFNVYDQGQLGSCVWNAICQAIWWLEYLEGRADFDPSRLFGYDVTRLSEGTPLTEDSGCSIADGADIFEQLGICTEKLWPYDPSKFNVQPSPEAYADARNHRGLLHFRVPSLEVLKRSIADNFPVVFGVRVYPQLTSDEAAETGIIRFPGPDDAPEGGHAMLAVGYDDDKLIGSDTGAVKILQSWGKDWGLGGYGWMSARYFTEGQATNAVTFRRAAL